jgi:hypothetical protein
MGGSPLIAHQGRDKAHERTFPSIFALKLDELLRAVTGARTALVDLESMTDEELDKLQDEFQRLVPGPGRAHPILPGNDASSSFPLAARPPTLQATRAKGRENGSAGSRASRLARIDWHSGERQGTIMIWKLFAPEKNFP